MRAHALSIRGMERAREKERRKILMQETSHRGHSKNCENLLYAKLFAIFKHLRSRTIVQVQKKAKQLSDNYFLTNFVSECTSRQEVVPSLGLLCSCLRLIGSQDPSWSDKAGSCWEPVLLKRHDKQQTMTRRLSSTCRNWVNAQGIGKKKQRTTQQVTESEQ